ncbi:hypothetical protein [Cesiribacter andamanensis]|uniref:Uncharacterized protein n=1 Tax=Cesiribacter andamanensis AMV16 TaxID=1279009 RepID=M7NRG4_9BACT|nr:hypothetical protein [Cesiribacter andamanensis]EMR04265.1 hypothetical protein ADICEAN_00551 [Cesiribacter andamanensis AMV16]
MLSYLDLLLLYFVCICVLIIPVIAGQILHILLGRQISNTFPVITFMLLVSICAIINTNGNTIFLLTFGLLALLVYDLIGTNKVSYSNSEVIQHSYKLYALQFIVFTLFFSYFSMRSLWVDCNDLGLGDDGFYAKVAAYIKYFSVETVTPDSVNKVSAAPYHYFELHLTVFISSLTQIPVIYVLQVAVPAVLLFYISYIFFILAKKLYNGPDVMCYFVSLIGLFLHGYVFDFYKEFRFLSDLSVFAQGPTLIKYMPPYIGLGLALYYVSKRAFYRAVLALLIASTVSITIAPVTFGGVAILLLYQLYGKNSIKDITMQLTVITASIAFYLIFYGVVNDFFGQYSFSDLDSGESFELSISKFLLMGRIFVGSILKLHIVYVPVLIILFITVVYLTRFYTIKHVAKRIQNLKLVLLFVYGMLIVCSSTWALLHNMLDSVQFFSVPAFIIISFMLFYFLFSLMKGYALHYILLPVLSLLILLNGINTFPINKQWASKCDTLMNSREVMQADFGDIVDTPYPQTILFSKNIAPETNIFTKNLNVYNLGYNYFLYLSDRFFFEPIIILDLPLHPIDEQAISIEKKYIFNSSLNRFKQRQRLLKPNQGIVCDFIRVAQPKIYVSDLKNDTLLHIFSHYNLLLRSNEISIYHIELPVCE